MKRVGLSVRRPISIPDLESHQSALRGRIGCPDALHPRGRRPAPQGRLQLAQPRGGTLGDDLDATVRKIAGPAGELQAPPLALHEGAEPYSLYHAPDHRRQSLVAFL